MDRLGKGARIEPEIQDTGKGRRALKTFAALCGIFRNERSRASCTRRSLILRDRFPADPAEGSMAKRVGGVIAYGACGRIKQGKKGGS